jgi:hypothetical protein
MGKDDHIQEYLTQLEKSYSSGALRRLGDIFLDGQRYHISQALKLDTEEASEASRKLFLAHQYRMLKEHADFPSPVTVDMLDDVGHDITNIDFNVDFDGPFGMQRAFGSLRLDRFITKYLVSNVFGDFLKYGEQRTFGPGYYIRGWRNEKTPDDLLIDSFLERGSIYQDAQVAFFNQGNEDDSIYVATDLRESHLSAKTKVELLERVDDYIVALTYSEILYPGPSNPFAGAMNMLLKAGIVLDKDFIHPFVGESEIFHGEGDEDGYFPGGYWAENPFGRRDSVFLGNSNLYGIRDRLIEGARGIVIGGRGIGHGYYPDGELVKLLD